MTTKSTERSTEFEGGGRRGRNDAASSFPLRDAPELRVPISFLVSSALVGAAAATLLALVVRAKPLAGFGVLGLVVAVALAWAHVRRVWASARAEAARAPRLLLDAEGLWLGDGDARTNILTFDRRFGLTLLASPSRRDLVLAITHRDGVEYLAGKQPSGTRHLDLLARAITTPENDLPIGDRVPVFVNGDRLLELTQALEARSPGAIDRVFLSDAGMADVVLDGTKLRAGQIDFDLRSPLAWRAYSFQEGSTFASHSFQATQIRQGDREVVLVALSPTGELATPSIVSPPPGTQGPLAAEAVQRALARDLRLAHCLADLPPPRAHRVAVDRLFMPRLRQALDGAPSEVVIVPAAARPSAPEIVATPPEGLETLRQSSPDVR